MNDAKRMGRPRKEVDENLVLELASIDCTEPEIAAVLGMSFRTWERRVAENPELKELVLQGRENGKASLRRLQWKTAQEGNATMQIWLGKQRLGQQDKKHIEQQNLEPLIIVRDTTDESADESIRQPGEVSGSGSGSEIREDIPRTH